MATLGAANAAAGLPWNALQHADGKWSRRTCAAPTTARMACNAQVATDAEGRPLSSSGTPVSGALSPAELHGAYVLPTLAPGPVTVAIVDAYNDPDITSDLQTFDSEYGLPNLTTGAPGCTLSQGTDGCFEAVNESGGSSLPRSNSDWALEVSLDVETVHEICQNCTIILVEASSANGSDLYTAEDEAVKLGATVVTNSWGGSEYSGEVSDSGTYFDHPGVAITASAGDDGYGVEFPAASPYVTAVGGTALTVDAAGASGPYTYGGESVWGNGQTGTDGDGTGSGCSAYEPKPAWQLDTGCANRTVNDVAADADPATGVAIYDSDPYMGESGWFQVGGTSLSAQIVGGIYGLSDQPLSGEGASSLYAKVAFLNPVTSGSDGSCGSYLCTAEVGYSGPVGLGTPDGMDAFAPWPTIDSLSSSAAAAGTQVTISGTYFTGATAVSFDGTAASFSVESATEIVATVPAGASSGPITVATPDGTSVGAEFTVAASPNLSVSVSASPQAPVAGSELVYTIGVVNVGVGASSATLTVALPEQVSLVSATASAGGSCGASGQTVTCSLGALAAGASSTETLTVNVTSAGSLVLSTATSSSPTESSPSDGAATFALQAQNPPPPTITSLSASALPVGGAVVITGSNLGGATAVSFAGTAALFTVESESEIDTTVPAGASSGPLTVTTPNGTAAGVSFTVVPPAPTLNVSVSANLQTAVVGSALVYTIDVVNDGGAASSGALTVALPEQVSFVSATASAGGSCGASGQTVSCSLGALAAAASSTETLTVNVTSAGSLVLSTATSSAPAESSSSGGTVSFTVAAQSPPATSPVSSSGAPSTGASGSPVSTTTPSSASTSSQSQAASVSAPRPRITLSGVSASSLRDVRPLLHLTVHLESSGDTVIELRGSSGKEKARWSLRLTAGTHHLAFTLPKAARTRGRDRVSVSAAGAEGASANVTLSG